MGINPLRAEELKRAYGLNIQSRGDVKITNLLMPLLDVIKRETEKAINNYFLRTKRKVEKVILTGGGSSLQGLEDYYSKKLAMQVVKGDPFSLGLVSYNPNLIPIIKDIGPSLTSACAVVFKEV